MRHGALACCGRCSSAAPQWRRARRCSRPSRFAAAVCELAGAPENLSAEEIRAAMRSWGYMHEAERTK